MLLFNPKQLKRDHADAKSRDIVEKTIAFFETKGLQQIKEDDQAMVWYEDFVEFIKDEQVFATLLLVCLAGDDPRARADLDGFERGAQEAHVSATQSRRGVRLWPVGKRPRR